jgi:hypothetical protein
MVFSGIGHVFSEPVRCGEAIGFFYGVKFHFYERKRSEIFFKDIQFCSQMIV